MLESQTDTHETPVTVSDVFDVLRDPQTRSLFVRNRATTRGRLNHEKASPKETIPQLVLEFPEVAGVMSRSASWKVPRTRYPVDLLRYITREQLLLSASFRTFLNSGALEYVPTREAQRIVSSKLVIDAIKMSVDEANRTQEFKKDVAARGRLHADDQLSTAEKAQLQQTNRKIDEMVNTQVQAQVQAAMAELSSLLGTSPELAALLARKKDPNTVAAVPTQKSRSARLAFLEQNLRAKERMSEGEVLQQLTAMMGDLSKADLESIVASPVFEEPAKEWAREVLVLGIHD